MMDGTANDDTYYGGSGADNWKGGDGDDLVYGGGGDDKLEGELGEDTLYGGTGKDNLKGGEGDDLVYGGADADEIDGQHGNDTIFGGDGDDQIKGDAGNDLIYAGEGDDQVDAKSGNNTVYGGDGEDSLEVSNSSTVYGGADNDTIKGGAEAMTAYGGEGDDYIEGGSGSDRFDGGAGDDTIKTGSGSDTVAFYDGGGHDTITNFDENHDVVEIGSQGIDTYADIQARMTDLGGDTQITMDDGSTIVIGGQRPVDLSASNFNIVAAPVCYAPGTLILTMQGEVPVQDLAVGDMLVTADHGPQPIRWIGRSEHDFPPGPHKHKPIEIKAGSLGDGLPRRTLIVSPQHRMLLSGPVVQDLFGEREVLALAKGLTGLDHVRAMNGKREITYFSLLCERHEVIMAESAWSESFYPGPTALEMIGPSRRRQVEALFPALRTDPRTGYGPKARRVLSRKETEVLVDLLLARGFGREDDEIAKWKREAGYREWDSDLADERATAGRRWDHLRLVE